MGGGRGGLAQQALYLKLPSSPVSACGPEGGNRTGRGDGGGGGAWMSAQWHSSSSSRSSCGRFGGGRHHHQRRRRRNSRAAADVKGGPSPPAPQQCHSSRREGGVRAPRPAPQQYHSSSSSTTAADVMGGATTTSTTAAPQQRQHHSSSGGGSQGRCDHRSTCPRCHCLQQQQQRRRRLQLVGHTPTSLHSCRRVCTAAKGCHGRVREPRGAAALLLGRVCVCGVGWGGGGALLCCPTLRLSGEVGGVLQPTLLQPGSRPPAVKSPPWIMNWGILQYQAPAVPAATAAHR